MGKSVFKEKNLISFPKFSLLLLFSHASTLAVTLHWLHRNPPTQNLNSDDRPAPATPIFFAGNSTRPQPSSSPILLSAGNPRERPQKPKISLCRSPSLAGDHHLLQPFSRRRPQSSAAFLPLPQSSSHANGHRPPTRFPSAHRFSSSTTLTRSSSHLECPQTKENQPHYPSLPISFTGDPSPWFSSLNGSLAEILVCS